MGNVSPPQLPWRSMSSAPRDGSIVIVLAEDFSCCSAYSWDVERDCWMQFEADWNDFSTMALYTYDDDLDGYGWVPAPEVMYTNAKYAEEGD